MNHSSASAGEASGAPLLLAGAFLALYLIWGSTYLFIGIAVAHWPPLLFAGVRFLIAGALLYGWLRLRGHPAPSAREWRGAAVIGLLLLGIGNGGVCVAEYGGVASGVAALSVATVPLFALLFAAGFGLRARLGEWLGIGLGIIGMVLLNLGANLTDNPQGSALLLVAAAAWAFGSVLSKRLSLPQGMMASAAEMLCGGAALLAVGLASGERVTEMPGLAGWLALGYLVVFGSLVAFSAYVYLLANVRPAAATSYAYVNPLVAVALGIGFAGERIGGLELVAMLVIVTGVVLVTLSGRTRPTMREAPAGTTAKPLAQRSTCDGDG
ncbi:drug/metabolite exporter YedA [Halotalea alkalilenta]|uniref:drug/metabolite exporter YedA n=1 Tax=Halotalea alkalilenta TaxID=376489 RepID=UPI0006949FBB|nr:drug/metabolite exporter YedA [Halotalea alkalilenta]